MKKPLILFCVLFLLSFFYLHRNNNWLEASTLQQSDTIEKQQHRANKIFMKLYSYSDPKTRSQNLDTMVSLYQSIIELCPDVPLAEESSLRLIEMYLRDFQPSRKDEALKQYRAFRVNYPESMLHNAAKATVERYLCGHRLWEELLAFETEAGTSLQPMIQPQSPRSVYLLSEAKYHLKDYENAKIGYELVIKYFPQSSMARQSQNRIYQIKNFSMNSK